MDKNLEDEERYICKRCKGTGSLTTIKRVTHGVVSFDRKATTRCPLCEGKGHIDWLQNLFGRKN